METSSTSSNPELLPGGSPRTLPQRQNRGLRLILAAAAAMVLGPVIFRGAPVEIGKWKMAKALDLSLDGRYAEAIAQVDAALAHRGAPLEWRVERAGLNRELGKTELALDDLSAVLKQDPANSAALYARSEVLYLLGKKDEAIADAIKLRELYGHFSDSAEMQTLNLLAYYRALGNRDLEAALADVNRALEIGGNDSSILDTRAFVHYKLGNYDLAAADMKAAISGARNEHEKLRASSARAFYDPRLLIEDRRRSAKSLATLYYHYSLILMKQKKTTDALYCRRMVKDLGFTPNDRLF